MSYRLDVIKYSVWEGVLLNPERTTIIAEFANHCCH